MLRLLQKTRFYCKIAENTEKQSHWLVTNKQKPLINYKELKFPSKVPAAPVAQFTATKEDVQIDAQTIQLLERLSLVDLDSEAALATLQSSIEFAQQIAHINTDNVEPLYTVLESHHLQLREDIVNEGNCKAEILQNAKVTEEDYFISPPGNIPVELQEKQFLKTDQS